MKTIFKIAKTELSLLFYSPIAWFLLIAFLFQAGLTYTGEIENYLITQEMGGRRLQYLTFLTSKIFAPQYGIWPQLVRNLYLYLPLLTMGLMSREINGGTIKLLYSSPIKVREIIFGKFFAMMIYNITLVGVLAIIVVCGLVNIHDADPGMLISGLVGVYILLCAYAAIGLFMSCLTSYQVVAALSTLVLLAALSYIGTVWQSIDFVRDLTYFLSISGRTDNMLLGMITTKDLLYFAVIIFIFLSFSIYKLQGDRESKPAWIKASRYVIIVVAGLAIGYTGSRPGLIGYVDLTATKSMTLTANSQSIIKAMGDEPLEVTSYINLLDGRFFYGVPERRNQDVARWEPYVRFKPDIHFKYVYYYDSTNADLFKFNPGKTMKGLAENFATSMKLDLKDFKTPQEIRKIIDLRPEQGRYVMQLKYKGRSTFLRLFDDQITFPTETETDAALKRLLQTHMPKIAFLQGDAERSIDKLGDRQYKMTANQITFRYSLVNQGFDVESVSLKDQDVPGDIAALVIADPKVALDTTVARRLQQYMAAGGNLLLAGEPGKQSLLNPLLQPLGVQFMDGMLIEKSKDYSPALIQLYPTAFADSLTKKLAQDEDDSLPVTMLGAAALTYTNDGPFKITPLLMTDGSETWNKKVKPTEDQIESSEDDNVNQSGATMVMTMSAPPPMASGKHHDEKPAFPVLSYSAADGDQSGPLTTAIALTRTINGKQQRIVVTGDADFLSNAELARYTPRTSNFDFSTALFSWFSNGEFPIDTSRPLSKDKSITLTSGGMVALKWLLLGILPGMLLVAGTIILIRRKRK
ncbi:MAG TPA: Gldg family protein [Dinghuibacter sp.]|uniref:Gldg family protein n=1 Tax=Dinghuibacter sp. TaxID=2024697 RepID=UPI002BB45064|nr:Gldg family protein [Dinghuibacter sp.]HTJ12576.1 Gldg family protein [Dinghuibacter sp.]